MNEWTFCRKCGWHSVGTFEACPQCGSGNVHRIDYDLSLDAEGNFFVAKGEKVPLPPASETKE